MPKMSNSIKNVIKNITYKTISLKPILFHWRKLKLYNKIVVLMYHEIADDFDDIDAWTVVKKSDFIRQMEYLSNHFNIISLKDAIALMKNKNLDNRDKPSVVITFDDGYKGNYQVLLPIIKSMNIPVTIFVATRHVQDQNLYWYDRLINALQLSSTPSPINLSLNYSSLGNYCINKYRGSENWRETERLLRDLKTLKPDVRENVVEDILKGLNHKPKKDFYNITPLSIKEVMELADCPLVTIGAHSHCHKILTQLTDTKIVETISSSKRLLEDWTGRVVNYFSYPNGNYNNDVINIIKKTGFGCSLTTVARPWVKEDSLFTIPRIGIGRYDSFDYFKVKVSGIL